LLINIDTNNPRLLEGLDVWLRMGLISDSQVREICQKYLTSPVPEPLKKSVIQPVTGETPVLRERAVTGETPVLRVTEEFAPEAEELQPARLRSSAKKSPNLISQLLESLKEELSVRWLLFLGLFMVVVSSGLLAASQWERFPAAGQYLVLLAYTTAFWGTAVWTGKAAGLRLTAQSLRVVTLLLVPVNFWAMDGLGLWGNFLEWGTGAIAAFILTFITVNLTKKNPEETDVSETRFLEETGFLGFLKKTGFLGFLDRRSLLLFNLLGLSYLQWGWGLTGFPITAVYLGVIGTAFVTFSRNRNSENNSEPLTAVAIVIYALAILLMRAIFVAYVDVALLGLAFGISGWILIKNNREPQQANTEANNPFTKWQNPIGGGLLLLGWSVSVASQPWQAFAISGIALWLLKDRLRQYWRKADLAAIFVIGWQAYSSVGRLIPPELRQLAINTGTEIARAENSRGSLLTVTWLPYLIFMVWVTDWLYRRDKNELARFGEWMALGFGAFLTCLGLINPLMRSLNLLASTAILAVVIYRRYGQREILPVSNNQQQPRPLFYLTHFVGLLAVCSWINYFLPNLILGIWAAILLALAVVEWVVFVAYNLLGKEPEEIAEGITTKDLVAEGIATNYSFALLLAAISYVFLALNIAVFEINNCSDFSCKFAYQWGAIWSIVPLGLTLVGSFLRLEKEKIIWQGVTAVIIGQALTFWQPETRLIGLGLGTVLMLVNTRVLSRVDPPRPPLKRGEVENPPMPPLKRGEVENPPMPPLKKGGVVAAAITVGFGLGFIGCGLWETIPGLSSVDWLLVVAIALNCLWWFGRVIIYKNTPLASVYVPAVDGWAIALCGLELGGLTVHSVWVYQELLPASLTGVVAAGLVLAAIAFRGWRRPTEKVAYSFAWGLELFVVEILGFAGESVVYLAIANLILGLISQLLGDWWQRKTGRENLPPFCQVIPLIYGIFGTLLRQDTFTNWTGLTTFALALIFIGVGRRKAAFKALVYLGVVGFSLALFEMLYYQVLELPRGEQLVAFATLGASVMYVYRLLASWLGDYLGFEEEEVKNIAHCHWGISSLFLVSATGYPIVASKFLALGTGIVLSRYAIFQGKQIQGRNNSGSEAGELWVYLGVLEGFALLLFVVNLLSLNQIFLPWAGAIASLIAYFIYFAPWSDWGWENRPWRRVALVLPIAGLIATSFAVELGSNGWYLSVAIAAVFYGLMARLNRQVRFTYISVVLINWAMGFWLIDINGNFSSLIYFTPPALSLLYFAQVEPNLKQPENRGNRHYLRVIGSGLICFVALFDDGWTGIIPGVISLATIFAGLGLRVRAFLYVGTATFLVNGFVQLAILGSIYSFLKWAIGLVVGIILIWIAATFETRREQIAALLQNWIAELENWE